MDDSLILANTLSISDCNRFEMGLNHRVITVVPLDLQNHPAKYAPDYSEVTNYIKTFGTVKGVEKMSRSAGSGKVYTVSD